MRGAVQKLADEGLQHIEYDNPGKRYYRRRLDSSIRNAFSGGMQRLSQAQNERLGRQFGADGMEVKHHSAPRPSHVFMGGRQYPMKQYEREIVPLLMEPNCYHRAHPIILGISPPEYTPADLDAMNAEDARIRVFEGKEYNAYEARQMQRRMETAIRRQKDRAVAAGKAGDKEAEQTALIKGAALNQKYAQFSKAAGLSYKGTRVTAGLNRSQSARLGAQTRRFNSFNSLVGIMTSDGTRVSGVSKHAFDRAVGRNVPPIAIADALQNPLSAVEPIRYNVEGKPSRLFTGTRAAAAINPDTGIITTVWSKEKKK